MSDPDPIKRGSPAASRGSASPPLPTIPRVTFDRRELDALLQVYGRMVAAGEWRDYALDFGRDAAVFSVFRRASETPLYRIEKHPKLRARQGAYVVISGTGLVLKRGHELPKVLKVFDKKKLAVVE